MSWCGYLLRLWHDWFDDSLTKRLEHVGSVSSTHVTGLLVVADGVPSGSAGWEHVGACSAVDGRASNLGSSLPDNLGEVSPSREVGHVWIGLSVLGGWEEAKLAVVPHVGDDSGNENRWVLVLFSGSGCTSHGNVLAVTTTTWGPVKS